MSSAHLDFNEMQNVNHVSIQTGVRAYLLPLLDAGWNSPIRFIAMNSMGCGGDEKCLFLSCYILMLCFAHTWQLVRCWCNNFFMPFKWYLFLSDAYVLLKPLCYCLLYARMCRQSFRISGTTMGVYRSPLSMVFCLRMLFSMVYMFLSRLLFSHCFLSCFVCGSHFWSLTNFLSFRGREMSLFTCTGSGC